MTAPFAQPSPRELGAPELAGYRVLRSLARDDDAEVLLGHRSAPASPDSPDVAARTVALKVFPASDIGWATAMRECAALERARGEHVVDLLDLDADHETIRLIFERLPRGDLAELLRVRARLDAGEAVTLLAPIAVTLLRLHAAGVAHGGLSARTVLFRDDGSPTLIGFSGAELFEVGAPEVVLEQVDAVRRDRAAARALAVIVLGRVAGGRARAARELHDDIDACDEELVLPTLAARLFEVAAAVPVRFAADSSDDGRPESDAAVTGPRIVPVGTAIVESGAERAGIAAALARLVPEPVLQRVLDTMGRSPAAPVVTAAGDAVRSRWLSWSPGRRRMVLAAGAAVVTVGVVTAVVPSGTTNTASAQPGRSTPSASAPADTGAADDPVVTGDDPLAASGALVTARDRCLSSLSVICLDRVDEAGSSALDGDRAAIRAAQQGGELPDPLERAGTGAGRAAPVLIERLGDSALVRLGDAASASLLLVKGEAGWRIRDVVAAAASAAEDPVG